MTTSDKVLLAVLVVFAILAWLFPLIAGLYMEEQERKKRGEPDNSKARYDERQKLIRLEAGNHALYALGAYMLLWLVLEYLDVLRWEARTVTLLSAGVLLALLVWSGECILDHHRRLESGGHVRFFGSDAAADGRQLSHPWHTDALRAAQAAAAGAPAGRRGR